MKSFSKVMRNRYKEEKKSAIIDREDSEEETSNDILNRIRINTNENFFSQTHCVRSHSVDFRVGL